MSDGCPNPTPTIEGCPTPDLSIEREVARLSIARRLTLAEGQLSLLPRALAVFALATSLRQGLGQELALPVLIGVERGRGCPGGDGGPTCPQGSGGPGLLPSFEQTLQIAVRRDWRFSSLSVDESEGLSAAKKLPHEGKNANEFVDRGRSAESSDWRSETRATAFVLHVEEEVPAFRCSTSTQRAVALNQDSLDPETLDRGLRAESLEWRAGIGVARHVHVNACELWLGEGFDPALLSASLDLLSEILARVTRQPDSRVDDLLVATPPPSPELVREATWIEAFVGVAKTHPGRIALSDQLHELTYETVLFRVSTLANELAQQGVGRDVLVGVAAESSVAAIITVLAIWRAGGAYLPLVPSLPAAYVHQVLESHAVALVVADASAIHLLPERHPTVRMEDLFAEVRQKDEDEPRLPYPEGGDLAYVLPTSGTTGAPRSAEVMHRGLLPLARSQARALGIDGSTVVAQFSSLAFDASVAELVATLLAGACLHVAGGEPLHDTLGRVNVATLPPSLWRVLDPEAFPAMRVAVTAGEPALAEAVRRWVEAGRRVVNGYGPTECTVCATMGELETPEDLHVGFALEQSLVCIVDHLRRPVLPLVCGEVAILGASVGRGYRNDVDSTRNKFVPLAWAKPAGEPTCEASTSADLCRSHDVMFLTGDLGFLDEQRRLRLGGRLDEQFKVRGFRIEPAEIELALRRNVHVLDARVVRRLEDDGVTERLVAYVVSERSLFVKSDFSAALAHLPAFYHPEIIVRLDDWPRTLSGKVDLAALPQPLRRKAAKTAPEPVTEPLDRARSPESSDRETRDP